MDAVVDMNGRSQSHDATNFDQKYVACSSSVAMSIAVARFDAGLGSLLDARDARDNCCVWRPRRPVCEPMAWSPGLLGRSSSAMTANYICRSRHTDSSSPGTTGFEVRQPSRLWAVALCCLTSAPLAPSAASSRLLLAPGLSRVKSRRVVVGVWKIRGMELVTDTPSI